MFPSALGSIPDHQGSGVLEAQGASLPSCHRDMCVSKFLICDIYKLVIQYLSYFLCAPHFSQLLLLSSHQMSRTKSRIL